MKINRTVYKSKRVQYICSFNDIKKELILHYEDQDDLYYYDEFALRYFEKEFKIRNT